MKTKFTTTEHLVLIKEDGTVCGIIVCEAGEHNVSEQVKDAIGADTTAECEVIIDENFEIGGYGDQFVATLVFEDKDFQNEEVEYSLTACQMFYSENHINEVKSLQDEIKERRAVSVSWGIADFESRAMQQFEFLDKDELVELGNPTSWEQVYDNSKFDKALKEMIQRHDATIGITWETIDFWLDELCKIKYFNINGYWVEDNEPFEDHTICSADWNGNDDEKDESIFFYGLSKDEIELAIKTEKLINEEFVITSYSTVVFAT